MNDQDGSTSLSPEDQLDLILKRAEPSLGSGRFFVSSFETGITLYKQQVRVLNLIYALFEKKRIKSDSQIAIIGGGVAGVTAAAALFKLGCTVYLFERNSVLCHLQAGCDTRWIHPKIYDWPEKGSETLYSGLPILDWQANTASEVIREILAKFHKTTSRKRIHLHTGAKCEVLPNPSNGRVLVKWEHSLEEPTNHEREFGAVIFTIGFGTENGLSYWRNDYLNQPSTTASDKTHYLISGTGDGGLIDLLRVRIKNFNQGRIVRELFSGLDVLRSKLRNIRKRWITEGDTSEKWLYYQYQALQDEGLLKPLTRRLKTRLRDDTIATLNGHAPDIATALTLHNASMLNTLLAFVLHNMKGGFDYKPGTYERKSRRGYPRINGVPYEVVNKTVVRHGTDREKLLKEAGCSGEEIDKLKANAHDSRLGSVRTLWPAGWWSKNAKTSTGKSEPIEFVPPVTQVIVDTFISTLSNTIFSTAEAKLGKAVVDFRLTLHRLIKVNEAEFFQQIGRYGGTRIKGNVGRVFTLEHGLVGQTCRFGRPIVIKTREKWNAVATGIDIRYPSYTENKHIKSLLTIPFFAPKNGEDSDAGKSRVCLVLYMDSTSESLFTPEILEVIYAACKGFVDHLEGLRSERKVQFLTSEYRGCEVFDAAEGEIISAKFEIGEDGVFTDAKAALTFKRITSFDTQLNVADSELGPREAEKTEVIKSKG